MINLLNNSFKSIIISTFIKQELKKIKPIRERDFK